MYHGVYPDSDSSSIDAEDLPYAVSLSEFTHQLDLLTERNVGLYGSGSGRSPDVVITFDDGHVSNLRLAAPKLVERNLAAYFFITSDFIGQRRHFMSADELAALSNLPDLCIGSHGKTHRFFDDMSSEESLHELIESRQTLENLCQSACRSISFPGGRFSPETLRQLTKAGYSQWFGSDIGLVEAQRWQKRNDLENAACNASAGEPINEDPSRGLVKLGDSGLKDRWFLNAQSGFTPLERIAVRRNTRREEFRRMIAQEPAYFRRQRLNGQVKHLVRRVIGNRLYHGLYKSFASSQ